MFSGTGTWNIYATKDEIIEFVADNRTFKVGEGAGIQHCVRRIRHN